MKTSQAACCVGLGAALALCACASTPQPSTDAVRDAGNLIAQAEDARASDYAPQEMRAAREKLQAALELSRQARNKNDSAALVRSRWLAEEAAADARLAEARAQASRMSGLLRARQRELEPASAPANGSQP